MQIFVLLRDLVREITDVIKSKIVNILKFKKKKIKNFLKVKEPVKVRTFLSLGTCKKVVLKETTFFFFKKPIKLDQRASFISGTVLY